jgi:EVE domain
VGVVGFTRDGSPIGAWVLKANPRVYDVDRALERQGMITGWSLNPSYRTALMKPGQRVFLWRSRGAGGASGIVATGVVTGEPTDDRGTGGEWIDQDKAQKIVPYVPVQLKQLITPISRETLQEDLVFASSELFRVKQMGNPVFLTPEELLVLDRFDQAVAEPTQQQLWNAQFDELSDVMFQVNGPDASWYVDVVDGTLQMRRWVDGADQDQWLGSFELVDVEQVLSAVIEMADAAGAGQALLDEDALLASASVDIGLLVLFRTEDNRFRVVAVTEDPETCGILDEHETWRSAIGQLAEELRTWFTLVLEEEGILLREVDKV